MLREYCHKNFHTFIFATQKTVDIFDKMEESYDGIFLKCIYFGIIYFSAKIKEGEFPAWQGTEYLSTILGTNWNPLFKFCYDYIRWKRIDIGKISEAKDAYEKMKLYDKNANRSDEDLKKIYSCYERTEIEVRDVLESIEKRLNNPKEIGFYNYGKLAAYLVMISHAIGFDYTKCRERMIQNIRGKGDSISSHLLFLPMYDLEGEEKRNSENGEKPEEGGLNYFSVLLNGVFPKARLLDLIRNFIVFQNSKGRTIKIIARYHQYFAVRKAVERTRNALEEHSRKVGVVWHTQGSGKSLSMVFYTDCIVSNPEFNNPTTGWRLQYLCGGGEKEPRDFDFVGGIYGENPQDEAQEYCCKDAAETAGG